MIYFLKCLQELIILLNSYYLELRNQLDLPSSITFGLELEFEHAIRKKIQDGLKEASLDKNWKLVGDISLDEGAEINSPILTDNEKSWQDLEQVCSIVSPFAEIFENSAGHIHVGSQALGNDKEAWLHFLRIWSSYENILYRFSYGEYLTGRPSMSEYAFPIGELIDNKWKRFQEESYRLSLLLTYLSMDRDNAVNFSNVDITSLNQFMEKNTLEFRCPNGSLNPVIWQNNVNLFTKLLVYAKDTSHYNEDTVEARHQLNHKRFMNLKGYDGIYLEQAVEFADLIFTNNLDKMYFLKQYLKSLEVKKRKGTYPKAKVLTK